MRRIMMIVCSCILVINLCSCSNKSDIKISKSSHVSITLKTTEEAQENISITKEQYENFCEYIDYNATEIPYSDIFGVEEAKKEKENYVFEVSQHSYDFFGSEKQVDVEKLYEVVKANNELYLSGDVEKHFNKELSDKQLRANCEIIADAVNWGITNIPDFDYARIGCILGNLKIVEKNASVYGSFNPINHVMAVTPDIIDSIGGDKVEDYNRTISHETMHLMQSYCPDVLLNENDVFIGVSCSFGKLPINPLKNSWLYEASAELNAAAKDEGMPMMYKSFIRNLETVSLATILNPNVKTSQLEKISFSNDIEKLYEQLEFEDKNKAIEFLYAVELLIKKPDDFKKVYEERNETLSEDDYKEFISNTYQPCFVEVTSKLFYKNLAALMVEKQIPLNDIFYLISLYEMDLQAVVPLKVESVRKQYSETYNNYLMMQEEFFGYVQKNCEVDVKAAFDEYSANYKDESIYANADLSWLDEEKTNYLLYRNECLYKLGFENVCFLNR